MHLKIAGELPLTTFFRPDTRKRKKENVPVPMVRYSAKRKRKQTDEEEEAAFDERPTKKRKGKGKEVAVLGDAKSKERFCLRDVPSGQNKSAKWPESSKQSSHLLTPSPEESSAAFTASSSQRDSSGVNNLSETQDLPSPSSFMRNVRWKHRDATDSQALTAHTSLYTSPPTARLNRSRAQISRNLQLVTYSDRRMTVPENATTSLPSPKSSVRRFDNCTEFLHLRKVIEAPATPSGIKRLSNSSEQMSEPLSSPLSSLPVTPVRRPHNAFAGLESTVTTANVEDHENIFKPVAHRNGDNDFRTRAKFPIPLPSQAQVTRISQPVVVSTSPTAPVRASTPGSLAFKLPALPIHHATHDGSTICTPTTQNNDIHARKYPPRLTRTEGQFVPSSQSQYMSTYDGSPRRPVTENKLIRSATLLLEDNSNRRVDMSIVQSSQSQIERELTVSNGYSQLLSGQISTCLNQYAEENCDMSKGGRERDKDIIHIFRERSDPLPAHTGNSAAIRTPTSSRVQRFSSFPSISFDCTAFEVDTEDSWALPAQGDFDDMFEDATVEDVHSQEQNQVHEVHLQEDRVVQSATESESDGDILDFYMDLIQQRGPKPSHSHHQTGIRGHCRIPAGNNPSQRKVVDDSDDLELTGAPFDIPDEFGPAFANTSFENSQQSLPDVAKDFFDMFQGSGSYPDDFPMSLR